MTAGLLQIQLQQPYRRATWQTILPRLLPQVEFFTQPADVPLTTARESEIASARRQIGRAILRDDAGAVKRIAIYEIEVAANVDLPRNRVALRELVARSIDQAAAHAVLAFFVQDGRAEYRLTYAARESSIDLETLEVQTRETAPKRFTFLLGPAEPCRTAAQRLSELATNREHLTFKKIEEAFSVERLNKEFFAAYKKHYQRFVDYLIAETDVPERIFGVTIPRSSEKEFDRACKPVRDFVKRLLGRIVFLHFLQRKGWLGCPAKSKDWHEGDREFMLHYLQLAESKGEADQFHSRWLTPLFFDALNNPDRPRDIFDPTGTRIPYLNGGLFEEACPAARALDFPQGCFRELLEFFGWYNFTIDENDPEESEIGIDPEMLGHIFENLLEDNKDKGAYYTPKPIVRYMSQAALLQYLRTHLGEHLELDRLVIEKDAGDRTGARSWIREHAREIERLIEGVKICDPAVGSGAFPIGLLHEMLQIKLALDLTLDPHEAKKTLIQDCLHGVDVDAGAIEIARLRFWLTLVVDAKTPEPLPNLDYKLYCADSLIERVRGEPVNIGTRPPNDLQLRAEITNLVTAKRKLYDAHTKQQKREVRHDLYLALSGLAYIIFSHLRNESRIDDAIFGRLVAVLGELSAFRRRVGDLTAELRKKAKGGPSMTQLDKLLDELQSWFQDAEYPTFLWQLHFGEVFAPVPAAKALDGDLNVGDALATEVLGGFDIVIENPPYVSALEHRRTTGKVYRDRVRSQYASARAAWDLYVPFFELTIRLLKQGGVATLISPNKYLAAPYAEALRGYLLVNSSLHELADVSREAVFIEADVYPVISRFTKSEQSPLVTAIRVNDSSRGFRYDNLIARAVSAELLRSLPQQLWAFLLVEHSTFLLRLLEISTPITEVCRINATTTAAEADEYGACLEDDGAGWRVANTGTIDPYTALWGKKRLIHQGDHYVRPTLPKDCVSNNRRALYESPKLVFAKMATRFEGFTDQDGTFAALNVNCAHTIRSGWTISALCGYCHSRVFHFIYTSFFDALRMAGGYLPFQAPLLRAMRVPQIDNDEVAGLGDLANACTAAADNDKRGELQRLQSEVDEAVCRMFGLTADETKIIQDSTANWTRRGG